jgi:hypothetical protein
MKPRFPRFILFLLLLTGWQGLRADALPVTVTLNTVSPGAAIPPDYSGLSFETSQALPGDDGKRYFSIEENKPLVTFYQTLGIKSLRIGGNQADRPTVGIPNNSDIDSLFNFAKAAGLKVIYTVRLKAGDPKDDARICKYIMDNYQPELSCFVIGNEPDDYGKTYTYEKYAADWKKFMAAIVAEVPNAMFCGPSTAPSKAIWVRQFAAEMGPTGHIAFITHHYYSGGGGGKKAPSPEAGRAKLLSPDMLKSYLTFSQGFLPAVKADGLPMRLEETNSFNGGGAPNVSETYATALWGLDYMYWWAEHGLAGVNFHSGDDISAMQRAKPTIYTPYVTGSNGFEPHPLAYGIKAFDLSSHGRLLTPQIANSGNVNMTAHAVLGDDGNVYVTLINKETTQGRDASVTISAGPGYGSDQTMYLTAPGGDVAAKIGVTLGGAAIKGDGTWAGGWSAKSAGNGGRFVVTVPSASAAIVKLTPG